MPINKVKERWLRASDIVEEYPIGLSTVWNWAKKGKLTPIKVSERVTVFSAEEVRNLFQNGLNKKEEKPQPRKKRRHKRKTVSLKKHQLKSDEEMIEEYLKREDSMVKEPTIRFEDDDIIVNKPRTHGNYQKQRPNAKMNINIAHRKRLGSNHRSANSLKMKPRIGGKINVL